MVLVTCAFYTTPGWFFVIPFTSLFGAALLFRSLLYNWLTWTLVTALLAFTLVQGWLLSGNHLYLLFYLSFAALVASLSPKPERVFARNARLMLGLIFVLAVFWKLVGPGFVSGTFFEFYLIHDERLAPVALLLTDLSYADVLANRAALEEVWEEGALMLQTTPQVERLALWLTWLTLVVEVSVAAAFLGPTKWTGQFRDPVLLAFLATAYLVVPVPSFGMGLACFGYAQTSSHRVRALYLVAFLVMPLTALRYHLIS